MTTNLVVYKPGGTQRAQTFTEVTVLFCHRHYGAAIWQILTHLVVLLKVHYGMTNWCKIE